MLTLHQRAWRAAVRDADRLARRQGRCYRVVTATDYPGWDVIACGWEMPEPALDGFPAPGTRVDMIVQRVHDSTFALERLYEQLTEAADGAVRALQRPTTRDDVTLAGPSRS